MIGEFNKTLLALFIAVGGNGRISLLVAGVFFMNVMWFSLPSGLSK